MLELFFWTALIVGIYPYAIYPLLVTALARALERPVRRDPQYLPSVTVVTAAFNEVRHIVATVENKLAQDYPADKLEVIVVSDGSEDGTDVAVQTIAARDARVRFIRQEPRQGKTAALNLAVRQARGEILVFADANSIYQPQVLRSLMANFADPKVGYVTGQMLYVNADGSMVGDGCTAYMRYENLLRAAETRIGSIVGVDGGVDAVRKNLYQPMRADQLPDFILPLNVVQQGYRVVYEPTAILNEHTLTTQDAEYRMRVRVALRSFWALWDKVGLMNPLRYGLFSWQLVSHKLLRYLSFLPLLLAAVLNWALWNHSVWFRVIAVGQLLFVGLILLALSKGRFLSNHPLVRYSYYFFLLNWSSAIAFGRFLAGQKQVLWQPRVG